MQETQTTESIPTPKTRPSHSLKKLYEERVICVPQKGTIGDVIHLMKTNHIGDVIVVETKKGKTIPIGIITDRDIALALESSNPPKLVFECMTSPIAVGSEDDDLFAMVETMKNSGIGRLPLVDKDGGIVGIVTAKKLLQKLAIAFEDIAFISERQQQNESLSRH